MMKREKYIIIFSILIILGGCVKRVEEPEILLSENRMRDLLIQIGLSKNIPQMELDTIVRNTKKKADKRVLKILETNNISLEVFESNHLYYTMYPERYKEILKLVKDSLNLNLKNLKIEDSLSSKDLIIKSKEIVDKEPKKSVKVRDKEKKDSILKPIKAKLDSLRKN